MLESTLEPCPESCPDVPGFLGLGEATRAASMSADGGAIVGGTPEGAFRWTSCRMPVTL
jgi:hypothetical protein